MTREEQCKKLFKKYGKAQLVVAMEELAELQRAVSKLYRYYDKKKVPQEIIDNAIEEIVDVVVMLDQVAYFIAKKTGSEFWQVKRDVGYKYLDKWEEIEKKLIEGPVCYKSCLASPRKSLGGGKCENKNEKRKSYRNSHTPSA